MAPPALPHAGDRPGSRSSATCAPEPLSLNLAGRRGFAFSSWLPARHFRRPWLAPDCASAARQTWRYAAAHFDRRASPMRQVPEDSQNIDPPAVGQVPFPEYDRNRTPAKEGDGGQCAIGKKQLPLRAAENRPQRHMVASRRTDRPHFGYPDTGRGKHAGNLVAAFQSGARLPGYIQESEGGCFARRSNSGSQGSTDQAMRGIYRTAIRACGLCQDSLRPGQTWRAVFVPKILPKLGHCNRQAPGHVPRLAHFRFRGLPRLPRLERPW